MDKAQRISTKAILIGVVEDLASLKHLKSGGRFLALESETKLI